MGRRKNENIEDIESKRIKNEKSDMVTSDSIGLCRQTRSRTKNAENTSGELNGVKVKNNVKKATSNGEISENNLEAKKRVVPKKNTKKTKNENGLASLTNIDIKEEIVDEKVKPSKRKLAKTGNNEDLPLKIAKKSKVSEGKQKIKEEKIVEKKENNEDLPPKIAKKSKGSKGKQKIKEEKIVEKQGMERSVVKKGAAAVDGLCPIASVSHVYSEKDDIWDCMLNQTNIQFNNNKYYIIQLLKDDDKNAYSVWMRWGRVGCPGQNALKPFGANLEKAKETFKKKFSDKTRNEWEDRENFEKVPGKYDLLQMDYSGAEVEVKKEEDVVDKPKKKVESKLNEKVKALIELICDVKAMERAVVEMKYDAKKAPLGKLTSDQVKAGYAALKIIEGIVLGSGKPSSKDLLYACNDFYTRIPHYFGMKVPPLIATRQEIQEKQALLQALGDIQIAMNVINQPLMDGMHPVDQHYEGLKCDISPLKKDDPTYKLLEKYILTTHGKTHSMYKVNVLEIYEAKKTSEETRFKDVGNRMLLWHGSRLTNWAGILSQGLRIAPPEAPSTGYMFGKGIYFADMASKSANYCMPSYQNKVGLLVLCDVSLGKCRELWNADYQANKLPKGYHSVKGLGRIGPDPKNYVTLPDGVTLPMGPGVDTNIQNKSGYTLQYNEYIVYDVSQVQIKYLFKVEFIFK